ncbi:MAG: dNTP triphosphohydrolase [Treponema sp.]|nr:dNTP triphosphohydrolase [Treponema sp.]
MEFNWGKLLSPNAETERSEPRKFDSRTKFDSDYSRITFSAPFRRLQDKTQVFPLEQNDFVRTRLTHSMEVASIARSLGKSIASELDKTNSKYGWKKENGNDISVILECAGLVHDIGNPPFGHSSEKAIQNWFKHKEKELLREFCNFSTDNISDDDIQKRLKEEKRIQDFLNFDGNVQGFRILTHLQCICDYYGYHLTSALLAAMMKYPVDSLTGNKGDSASDHKLKKFGYFDAECESAEFVLKECGLIDDKGEHYRSPLTFILEAADDIAYSAADIEDGFKKGLFSLNDLLAELKKEKTDECINQVLKKAKSQMEKTDLLNERKIQWLRICIHQVYCDTLVEEFIKNYDKIMRGTFADELLKAGKLKKLRSLLERFSYENLINNQEVSKIEIAGKNVISFLLGEFSNDLISNGVDTLLADNIVIDKCIDKLRETKTWNLISEDFKDIFIYTLKRNAKDETLPKTEIIYHTYLLITDFISGMTDNYCIRLYRRLMGITIN